MRPHLLVTNDFPPKIGGIQSYLWELWRRLPPEAATVLTTPHRGAAPFDAAAPMRVLRTRERVLLPRPSLVRRIRAVADDVGAELVLLDPAVPLGMVGPRLGIPYGVVLHGAEVTVPARLPGISGVLSGVLEGASVVISAGGYAAAEAQRCASRRLPVREVPPGVDVARFVPLCAEERLRVRRAFGLDAGPLVVCLSRLVPRKGFDAVIEAAARLRAEHPGLQVAVAGAGRDRRRLERLARRCGAAVVFSGRIGDEEVPRFMAMGDVFAAPCRNRWAGLEQEGFGIVFVEAAACGVPVVAGRSGGSHEAVVHGRTGLIVERPTEVDAVAEAIDELLSGESRRAVMGAAARRETVQRFSWDLLAAELEAALS
ncbi:glycosyltransferase family 4 protein [Candidatus Poriferisodalis sp.]|uniref:glycosyltransferase family 4 protein n=1 Tax=Candidatus Poriferisodalis sp. TaxID=3101277 RepID=UPI003B01651D